MLQGRKNSDVANVAVIDMDSVPETRASYAALHSQLKMAFASSRPSPADKANAFLLHHTRANLLHDTPYHNDQWRLCESHRTVPHVLKVMFGHFPQCFARTFLCKKKK